MSNGNGSGNIFWQIAVPVIVTLLVGGTSPWWWQEFVSQEKSTVEVDSIPEPKASDPSESPEAEAQEPEQELEPTQKASISLAYAGDYFACSLPVAVSIGDRSLYPSGNSNVFQFDSVDVGQQRYQIEGQIHCPTLGRCQVYGEGDIKVIPGNTYFISNSHYEE